MVATDRVEKREGLLHRCPLSVFVTLVPTQRIPGALVWIGKPIAEPIAGRIVGGSAGGSVGPSAGVGLGTSPGYVDLPSREKYVQVHVFDRPSPELM